MDYCKPCPECEWDYEPPNAYVIMGNIISRDNEVLYSEKEYVKLKCPKCNYEVYAKSVREAISKWNEESDKNAKENHIHKVICERCGKEFDECPNPEEYIKEAPLDLSVKIDKFGHRYDTGYNYILPCCKYESERFRYKNICANHFKNQFKEVTLQKEIDYKKEN